MNDCESFENIFFDVLIKNASLRKRYVRANDVPYMTKALRKAIMKKSELERKYFNNLAIENRSTY